jgi:hypothetical protein
MGAIDDTKDLEDQDKIDQQQAAASNRLYNPDGSAKANDYRAPKLPESTFPATVGRGGTEVSVSLDSLSSVKGQMGSDLSQLTDTLSQLQGEGAMGGAIGGWSTADAFGGNATNAYEGITQFMQALNGAYDEWTGNLGKAVANYSDADETTASAATKIGSESAPNGSLSG